MTLIIISLAAFSVVILSTQESCYSGRLQICRPVVGVAMDVKSWRMNRIYESKNLEARYGDGSGEGGILLMQDLSKKDPDAARYASVLFKDVCDAESLSISTQAASIGGRNAVALHILKLVDAGRYRAAESWLDILRRDSERKVLGSYFLNQHYMMTKKYIAESRQRTAGSCDQEASVS